MTPPGSWAQPLKQPLGSPPEPQTRFLGTSKTGASSAKATQWECHPGAREHFQPCDVAALQSSLELDTPRSPPGNALSETACLRRERREPAVLRGCAHAEPSASRQLCWRLSPGNSRKQALGSELPWRQTPPPLGSLHGMATAFFPAHNTPLSSLKRKKCFLNKINNPPPIKHEVRLKQSPRREGPRSGNVRVSHPFPRGWWPSELAG